jgi:hypothetical protein
VEPNLTSSIKLHVEYFGRELDDIASTLLTLIYCFAECQFHPSIIEHSIEYKGFTMNLYRLTDIANIVHHVELSMNSVTQDGNVHAGNYDCKTDVYKISSELTKLSLLIMGFVDYDLPVLMRLPNIVKQTGLFNILKSILEEFQHIYFRINELINCSANLVKPIQSKFDLKMHQVSVDIIFRNKKNIEVLLQRCMQICLKNE